MTGDEMMVERHRSAEKCNRLRKKAMLKFGWWFSTSYFYLYYGPEYHNVEFSTKGRILSTFLI
jgi:hypothetical protein